MPDNWNELEPHQLLFVAEKMGIYDEADAEGAAMIKSELAFCLSNIYDEPEVREARGTYFETQVREKLLPAVDFIFKENNLTKNLLPKVRIRKGFVIRYFYGPADNFINLSFEEFDDAEYWFAVCTGTQVSEQDRAHALDMLCAILYREYFETKSDTRQAYSPFDNESRSKWMACLDPLHKAAILLWYIGCRNQLVNDFKPLFEGGSRKTETAGGWTMLAHSLSGPVLGDIDKVNRGPVRRAFTEMLRLWQIAEEKKES